MRHSYKPLNLVLRLNGRCARTKVKMRICICCGEIMSPCDALFVVCRRTIFRPFLNSTPLILVTLTGMSEGIVMKGRRTRPRRRR